MQDWQISLKKDLFKLCVYSIPSLHKLKSPWAEQGCQMVSFQTKNPCSGMYILEDLRMENVVIFSGHLAYFIGIW
jgi:hypothetical protein